MGLLLQTRRMRSSGRNRPVSPGAGWIPSRLDRLIPVRARSHKRWRRWPTANFAPGCPHPIRNPSARHCPVAHPSTHDRAGFPPYWGRV